MDELAKKLDEGLSRWKPRTVAAVREELSLLMQKAELGCFEVVPRPPSGVQVAIIGADHSLQWKDAVEDGSGDLSHYREIVKREIASCDAVLEEAGEHENRSFAQDVADKEGVRYLNIDIPHATQEQVRHQGLRPDPGHDIDPLDNLYARAWNFVREHHMREVVRSEVIRVRCDDHGGKILVICGLFHIDAIQRYSRDQATVSYLEVFKPRA